RHTRFSRDWSSDVCSSDLEETRMTHAGNSIHMAYTLRYGQPGDTIDLHMDDWMYQVADGVVINETRMSKWGLDVGQVLLVMRQRSEERRVGKEWRCRRAPP